MEYGTNMTQDPTDSCNEGLRNAIFVYFFIKLCIIGDDRNMFFINVGIQIFNYFLDIRCTSLKV